MTAEPPKPARRTRPDRSFRARALGLDVPAPDVAGAGSARASLKSLLAAIPDLERSQNAGPDSGVWSATGETYEVVPTPAPTPRGARRPPALDGEPTALDEPGEIAAPDQPSTPPEPVELPVPVEPPEPAGPPEPVEPPEPAGRATPAPQSVPWWRRVAFAVVVVGLIGAIPVLASTGYRLVTRSTDGTFSEQGATRSDPGFEELVTSTPTALVIQTDAEGLLVGVTFLALGAEDGGGSITFIPVDTLIAEPGFGIDRLSGVYTLDANVESKLDLVASNAADILNVGMDEIIALDDQGWTNAVDPVAPFAIRNLDSLVLAGAELPAGRVDIAADQVGPYLATLRAGETEASRLGRHEKFWRGWLDAVGESNLDDVVPGERGSGLGRFIRTLARDRDGVRYEILPGAQEDAATGGFAPDEGAVKELVAQTVPVPDAARPGSRRTVRLLNGVSPGPIPLEVIREVTALEGAVTVVGNGPDFANETTSIVYADTTNEAYAEILKGALGGTATVERLPEAPDNVDVTIVLGRDVLGDTPPASTTTSAPSRTPSTVPGEN